MTDRSSLDFRVDATNALNNVTYPNWNTTVSSAQFGLPTTANAMRSLQTTDAVRIALIMMRAYPCFVFRLLSAGAQQVGQNARRASTASTFRTSTQLVVETVSVKDKNGNAIENLTANDSR